MAQGPSDTILVAIRIMLRIRESKVRNPDPPDYSKNCKQICVMPCSVEVCALWVLLVYSAKLAYVHFNFYFISLFNPQLTSLNCNFSYGSKNSHAKYFGRQSGWGAILYISPPPTHLHKHNTVMSVTVRRHFTQYTPRTVAERVTINQKQTLLP